MSGIDSSSLAEILPRPPNRQFKLGSEDFPPFRCVVAGVTEKGKVLVPSVNPFSCALPMSNDSHVISRFYNVDCFSDFCAHYINAII
ncbi:hypothetical protein MA16_Dca028613 [Dendrobium catenatum]|uniref:Uncharacterized protein n=1 Tax=Dendrobium catenatum TaxID=906689 RepID=A0A2I0VGB2_9ASPA|nr:hypothetical protein MA16_Dca028613 [Dendrobium catenatum]